jgi:membrane protease YdiL (CAAX protease family)
VADFLKKQVYPEVLAWLCLAVGGGSVAAALWWYLRKRSRRPLPPQRHLAVPWGGLQVGAVAFLGYLFPLLVVPELLTRSGFFSWYYGPGFALPTGPADTDLDHRLALARQGLWVEAFAFPYQLSMMLFLWLRAGGTRLYQLGLTGHRLARNVVVGYLAWLVLAAPVDALYALIALGYHAEPHPLTILMEQQPSTVDWLLVVLTAVVAAPILEELLFRGILQAWLTQRSWGGHVAVVMALMIAALVSIDRIQASGPGDSRWDTLDRLAPVLFVLATLPAYVYAERLTWRWLPYPYAAQGIYGSALLWAMVHAPVWPSPLPLFFLGLGLGYLAYRTQSVIGTMVAHALFNGMSCLSIAIAQGPLAL